MVNDIYKFFEEFASTHVASMAPENVLEVVDLGKEEEEENDG